METSTILGTFLATIHQWLECARSEEVIALSKLVNAELAQRARAAHPPHQGRNGGASRAEPNPDLERVGA